MTKLIIFKLVLLIFSIKSWSQDHSPNYATFDQVKIEAAGKQGKSMVIDRGHLENYQVGDIAKVYIQWGPVDRPKAFLVADAELVKVFPKNSYWDVKTIYIPGIIAKDQRVLLITDEYVSSGRNDKIKNKHIVFSSKDFHDAVDYENKNKNTVPDRLVKKEIDYGSVLIDDENKINPELSSKKTAILKTHEYYKSSPSVVAKTIYGESVPKKFFVGSKEVEIGDVKKLEDKLLLLSMVENYEEKVKNMEFGVDSFYRHSKAFDVSQREISDSMYETFKKEEKENQRISKEAIAKVKRDGQMWSASFDDESLRNYFVKTGIESEITRRQKNLSLLDGNEIVFYYSGGMLTHSTPEDSNYQARSYNLGISYDYHFSRLNIKYINWTMQILYEAGISNFDIGGVNVKSDDVSFGGYLNYYVLNNPLSLNKFSILVGAGFKTGQSVVQTPKISKKYLYQVLSPSIQTMIKYRFKSGNYNEDNANVGMSLNFGATMDFRSLALNEELDDEINSKLLNMDLKYSIGLSVYF